MPALSRAERFTEHFYAFEVRGRGWVRYPYRVELEPPFIVFQGYDTVAPRFVDDGRHHTWASRLIERFIPRVPEPEILPPEPDLGGPPEPWRESGDLHEFSVTLPAGTRIGKIATLRWLGGLATLGGPVSYELVADGGEIHVLVACRTTDELHLRSSLEAFFPDAVIAKGTTRLRDRWSEAEGGYLAILEHGLARECVVPLVRPEFGPDPLLAIAAGLSAIEDGDLGIFQVLFEEVRAPWAESILRAVHTPDGQPFFADAPEITAHAKDKISSPLYAVVLRLAAKSKTEGRAWDAVRQMAGGLSCLGSVEKNALLPLLTEDITELEDDVLDRTTHRSGMLLSADELVSLVHLPSESMRLPALNRLSERTKAAPAEKKTRGIYLGDNEHQGASIRVHLPPQARLRHTHLIGASGTGKSTLMVNMILDDIARGDGVAVLDPHGDLVDAILGRIPEERLDDVVLFDPADDEYVTGWNILGANSEIERQLVSSDLVSVFRRLSTSWGDQMTAVLANAILAFLESSRGGTLADLRMFLVDSRYRDDFLTTVEDEQIVAFWRDAFPLLVGKKPQGPILTRLDTFLRSKLVRRIVTVREPKLDFRRVMDEGRIFLGKLAQGALGEENSALLGSLLVSKLHQVTLSRADIPESERRHFYLYVDEFHEVATASMATIFSGVRKYGLGLTVAHQDLYQLHGSVPEVERAVMANAHTRICFRVGDEDARKLERGFAFFGASDLVDLGIGKAIARVGRSAHDFNLRTFPLPDVDADELAARQEAGRARSREQWGTKIAGPAPAPSGAIPLDPSSIDEPQQDERPPQSPPEAATPHPTARTQATEARPSTSPLSAPTTATTPGRGGEQHKYLQGLVKSWGETQGFRAVVEEHLTDGGRVDVALHRDDEQVAVEIAISSSVVHEVENVEKCLAAGFDEVVVVATRARFLRELGKALDAELAKESRARVKILRPEELFTHIASKGEPETKTVAGYKVTVRRSADDLASDKAKQKAVADVVLRSLRRLRKTNGDK